MTEHTDALGAAVSCGDIQTEAEFLRRRLDYIEAANRDAYQALTRRGDRKPIPATPDDEVTA